MYAALYVEGRRSDRPHGGAVLATVAVTQGWGWPLLGSVSAGMAVMFGVGAVGCALGLSTLGSQSGRDSLAGFAGLLGAGALAVFIFGPRTEAWMIALAALIVALWVVSTARHFLRNVGGAVPRPAA